MAENHDDDRPMDPDDRDDVRRFCQLADPDNDDVPIELAMLDRAEVRDITSGLGGTLVIVPELFGHSRRLREGFYGSDGGAESA